MDVPTMASDADDMSVNNFEWDSNIVTASYCSNVSDSKLLFLEAQARILIDTAKYGNNQKTMSAIGVSILTLGLAAPPAILVAIRSSFYAFAGSYMLQIIEKEREQRSLPSLEFDDEFIEESIFKRRRRWGRTFGRVFIGTLFKETQQIYREFVEWTFASRPFEESKLNLEQKYGEGSIRGKWKVAAAAVGVTLAGGPIGALFAGTGLVSATVSSAKQTEDFKSYKRLKEVNGNIVISNSKAHGKGAVFGIVGLVTGFDVPIAWQDKIANVFLEYYNNHGINEISATQAQSLYSSISEKISKLPKIS